MNMITLHCENCKVENVPQDKVRMSLTMNKTYSSCDKCHHHSTDDHLIWFCSENCFVEYMTKRVDKFKEIVGKFRDGKLWDSEKPYNWSETQAAKYQDYKWIKVKKHKYDPDKTWEENYKDLDAHHVEETMFMIREVKDLAARIDKLME